MQQAAIDAMMSSFFMPNFSAAALVLASVFSLGLDENALALGPPWAQNQYLFFRGFCREHRSSARAP